MDIAYLRGLRNLLLYKKILHKIDDERLKEERVALGSSVRKKDSMVERFVASLGNSDFSPSRTDEGNDFTDPGSGEISIVRQMHQLKKTHITEAPPSNLHRKRYGVGAAEPESINPEVEILLDDASPNEDVLRYNWSSFDRRGISKDD